MERIKEALNKARSERYTLGLNSNTIINENNPSIQKYSDSRLDSNKEPGDNHHRLNSDFNSPIKYNESTSHHASQEYLKKKRIIVENDKSPAGKAFNLLRTKILQKLNENNWNSFAVVSANSGEGKTLTAINLAISIARDVNYTALLADFDMINPAIHTYFDYYPEYSLVDYLQHNIALNKVLMNPGIDGLLLLPGSNEIFNSAETLASPVITNLTMDLKAFYQSRIVIYDLPPLLETDDALAFSSCFDAVLIVVEDGKTTANDIKKIEGILGNKPVLGTVLNKIPQ